MRPRRGFGTKNGSQQGLKAGGQGRNRTSTCRHPTIKPVEIITTEIEVASRLNGIVVDPFGGSGSTLIACEKLGRRCYMMEISPEYTSVIKARWEAYTGKKAVLVSLATNAE